MKRVLFASPFFLISAGLLLKALGAGNPLFVFLFVVYAAAFMMVGAIIIVPPLTSKVGEILSFGVLLPERRQSVSPRYSVAESLVKRGKYEEAIERFRETAWEHPAETRPWIEMISVAAKEMKDLTRADAIYREARQKFEAYEDLKALKDSYRALKSLAEDKPDWLKSRTIAYRQAAPADRSGPAETRRAGSGHDQENSNQVAAPPKGYIRPTAGSPFAGETHPNAGGTQRRKLTFDPEEIARKAAARKTPAPENDRRSPRLRKTISLSKTSEGDSGQSGSR